MAIVDSGSRREFKSGAVRDVQAGKGRCDLLPLEELADLMFDNGVDSEIILSIKEGVETKEVFPFLKAIRLFAAIYMEDVPNAMLQVAIHFEEGAEKYAPNNWKKGIDAHCYIDSALRHLLKFFRGDEDERHDRAFIWNLMCLVWTIRNKPECNDIWGETK